MTDTIGRRELLATLGGAAVGPLAARAQQPAMPVIGYLCSASREDDPFRGGGFEAYAADDHCLGLFPAPRAAAATIAMTRPWVARMTAGPVRTTTRRALEEDSVDQTL